MKRLLQKITFIFIGLLAAVLFVGLALAFYPSQFLDI